MRHKIQHGDFIKDFNEEDYVNLIYKKILVYFNNEYCLNLNLDVVSPQRHFYWNLEYVRLFLKPKDDTINVDLRDIPENIEDAIRKEDCPFLYENRNSDWY